MGRPSTLLRCGVCGAHPPRWTGRCSACGEWGSIAEAPAPVGARVTGGAHPGRSEGRAGGLRAGTGQTVMALGDVDLTAGRAEPTGIDELDRVLAGGLVPGSVTLVGGEPGVGKSTLVLQVLAAWAARGRTVLLVAAEESTQQVRARAERLGSMPDSLLVLGGGDLSALPDAMAATAPDLVVVDSIQTVTDPAATGAPGGLTQVRACTELLVALAAAHGAAVVIVGHVTKEGGLAGPRRLEHVVDTVLTVEGDRHHALRLVRAVKHRFGPTGEVGLFEMADGGLRAVQDPYRLLLGDRRPGATGSAVLPATEGERALVVEVQALASRVRGTPRRSAQGLDPARLAQVTAVLERHCGIETNSFDVLASVVGGIRITEPGADLALALAVVSAVTAVPLADDLVAFGEVGLAGEVRQVRHAQRRLQEAARLGFRRAIAPESTPEGPPGLHVARVRSLKQALAVASAPPRHLQPVP